MESMSAKDQMMPDAPPFAAVPENYFSHDNEKSSHAFRTISEVSHELDVPQHVLRFWESRFSQIRPLKRAGGRRYYRPEDIELLRRIKNYLYKQGYTIKGVQRLLKENRAMPQPAPSFAPYAHPLAGVPGYQIPSAIMNLAPASLLQAAAAAPSAMAMAYGAVSNTLHAEGLVIREFEQKAERFGDALAEATSAPVAEPAPAAPLSQLSQSLEAVTEIRDQIAHGVTPIRVDARPDVLDDIAAAQADEPVREMAFDFDAAPSAEEDFSQEQPEVEPAIQVESVQAESESPETLAAPEIALPPAPDGEWMAAMDRQRAELKELLAELVALRAELHSDAA